MDRKGAGKRLSDTQGLEIILCLDSMNALSKRQLVRQYEVDDKTICNIHLQRSVIMIRAERVSDNCGSKTFRARKQLFVSIVSEKISES